jgi:hypothetical protein
MTLIKIKLKHKCPLRALAFSNIHSNYYYYYYSHASGRCKQ